VADFFNSLLEGRLALVAGASSGIGRAVAEAFSAAGARVHLLARCEERLAAVAASLPGSAGRTSVDLAETAAIPVALRAAAEDLGGLDILVNSAGISLQRHSLDTTDEDFTRLFQVNLLGAFTLAREAALTRRLRLRSAPSQAAAIFGPAPARSVSQSGCVTMIASVPLVSPGSPPKSVRLNPGRAASSVVAAKRVIGKAIPDKAPARARPDVLDNAGIKGREGPPSLVAD
jgi:NAD(P)-dependent dehydrogenase (short-subunit alcohol dehydrogenase family)